MHLTIRASLDEKGLNVPFPFSTVALLGNEFSMPFERNASDRPAMLELSIYVVEALLLQSDT